jgi:hypothetical protein
VSLCPLPSGYEDSEQRLILSEIVDRTTLWGVYSELQQQYQLLTVKPVYDQQQYEALNGNEYLSQKTGA